MEMNRFYVGEDIIEALSKANTVYIRLSGSNYYHKKQLSPSDIKNLKCYIAYIKQATKSVTPVSEK